jgi:hypothetical protein
MAKSPKPEMSRVVADLPTSEYEEFKELAKMQDLTVNQLVRRCIRKELSKPVRIVPLED